MATLEQHRQSIVTAIEAARVGFTAYPLVIEHDNRNMVDTATQLNPFLAVNLRFLDGAQADLSTNPIHRKIGQIHLQAAVKEGSGTAKAYELLEFFYSALQAKQFGGVRTRMASFAREQEFKGWVYYPALVPFWTDDN
jgi:hypothetical protein